MGQFSKVICVAPIVENNGLALPPASGRPVVGFGVENHTRPALVGLRIHNTTSMYIQPHRGPLHGTMEHSTCFNTDVFTTMRPNNADGAKQPRTQYSARQHKTEQNETTQRTTTQRQAAQRAAQHPGTHHSTPPRHDTRSHQDPPGDNRGQPGPTANTQTQQATTQNTSQPREGKRAPNREH